MSEIKNRKEEYKQYDLERKDERKQYYQDNKDKFLASAKAYKQRNPEKQKEYDQMRSKLIICCPTCNYSTNQRNLSRHQQTKRCKEAQTNPEIDIIN